MAVAAFTASLNRNPHFKLRYRMQNKQYPERLIKHIISGPIIWAMLIPVFFADICLELYHRTCFPLYGLEYVRRSKYIRVLDRTKLPYLNWSEKLGCMYCGYVNGWLHYASVIAGKTEHYWCGIMHLEDRGYVPSVHEAQFVKYGDEAEQHKRYAAHEPAFSPRKQ